MGSVVVVGGNGTCAGELAEESFRFAICACDTIEVQSTISLDGFDSRLGPYGAALPGGGVNINDDGQLGINGALTMDGKLEVRGSAFIGGGGVTLGPRSQISRNLYAAGPAVQPNSSSTIERNAFIDGDVSGRFDIMGDLHVPTSATVSGSTQQGLGGRLVREAIPHRAPCACGATEILDVGALTGFGRTHNDNAVRRVLTATTWASGTGPQSIALPCGRYYLTRIQHPGTLNIRAEGRVVLFVDGDMTIGGGFDLSLGPDAEVDLFIAGNLSVQASASFGSAARPAMVRTYVGGTGDIQLNASSTFGGNLYAPRSRVVFGASASLHGALVARRAEFSGSASVHFDRAIRSAGQSCQPATDGGTPADGGTQAADSGTPADDGGPADAGTPATDAGTPTDSGISAADSGVVMCSGCGQCGTGACVNGQCGPCQNDLDCCAPNVCLNGQCTVLP